MQRLLESNLCPASPDLYCLFLFYPYYPMCRDYGHVTSVQLALTFTVSFYFNPIILCAGTTGNVTSVQLALTFSVSVYFIPIIICAGTTGT